MPIKHEFVFKTIVRGSKNVETPTTITNELASLKKEAFNSTVASDAKFTVLIQKRSGVIYDGGIDVEGKLNTLQESAAKNIHTSALKAVTGNGDDKGKIKVVFVVKKD